MKFINKENIRIWASKISEDKEVFYPENKGDFYEWKKLNGDEGFNLTGFRPVLPVKYLFYSPQELLKEKQRRQRVIFGIRGCDLRGLKLLEKIYLEEPLDPYYRKENIIIGTDCTAFDENCFCVVLGDNPWCEDGFDINLSYIEDGYVVDSLTERGEKLINDFEELFEEINDDRLKLKEEKRKEIKRELKEKNKNRIFDLNDLKQKIEKNFDIFKEQGSNCVSCSTCTNVCPACFCFFLTESNEGKARYMDSCQLIGYARVAGGANPRKDLTKRFKHRFECKFVFRPEMHGFKGCTGCGRCVSGCQGGINWFEVLEQLYSRG